MINRTEKLSLLTSLLNGTVTPKQLDAIRDSQKPLELTMNLDDEDEPIPLDPDQPIYHIELYSDHTTKSYYRYPDGRIEYLN